MFYKGYLVSQDSELAAENRGGSGCGYRGSGGSYTDTQAARRL